MVDRFVTANFTLEDAPPPSLSFDEMFLSNDDSIVPLDRRYLRTTRSSYATDIPAGTEALDFATNFWAQKRTAKYLYVGRWADANQAPYYVSGTTSSMTIADWIAISDGTFTITDDAGTPNTDDFTGVDFTSDVTSADIIATLNAELVALGGGANITGLATATFEFDNFGRLRLVHSVTGASAVTLAITSEGTGTDLTGATYFNIADGFIISGIDAEEPTAAVTAIRAINDAWYRMNLRNESAAQQQALATQFESLRKMVNFMTAVAADKDPASTSDVPYLLSALDRERSSMIYTEHTITATGGWVDAAVDGAVLPAAIGSTDWANETLSGVFSSGKASDGSAIELNSTATGALEAKNCNWVATTTGGTFLTRGVQCSGDETWLIAGIDWMETELQRLVHAYNLSVPKADFSNTTLTAYERCTNEMLAGALGRTIIVNTPDRPITVLFPDADDFTATERTSGDMVLEGIFTVYANAGVKTVQITANIKR